jgi:hypothetical protein
MAAFLRDVVDASAKHRRTTTDLVKDGFAIFCDDYRDVVGVRIPFLTSPDETTDVFVELTRPRKPPENPALTGEVSPQRIEAYEQSLLRWRLRKDLYDKVFAARALAENMELVVSTALLVADSTSGRHSRHLITVPAIVDFDGKTGTVRVRAVDVARVETNWVDSGIRGTLIQAAAVVDELAAAQSMSELGAAIRRLANAHRRRRVRGAARRTA